MIVVTGNRVSKYLSPNDIAKSICRGLSDELRIMWCYLSNCDCEVHLKEDTVSSKPPQGVYMVKAGARTEKMVIND